MSANEGEPPATAIVVGALVCWRGAPGEPLGEVESLNGNVVTVMLDGLGRRQFALASRALERVQLPPRVRRYSTGEPGIVIGPVVGDVPRWAVLFPTGEKRVGESDLRPDVLLDPISRMQSEHRGTGRQFLLRSVGRFYQTEHLHNPLVSLADARVDLRPHQIAVVHRVVANYPHRFLLCDEVGLGKTIEAGMIVKELRARGGAKRALVIVPPNLVRQWQFELRTKYNEAFAVLNRDTVRYLASQNVPGNPFAHYDSVIVSAAWAADPSRRRLITELDWDVVIVDEAHHARLHRSGNKVSMTQLYQLVRDLSAPEYFSKRALLFLTATPLQLERYELYSLIEMLDPALFPTEEHFERHVVEGRRLSTLVDGLRKRGWSGADDDADEVVRATAHFLTRSEESCRRDLAAGGDALDRLCSDLTQRHLLSEVLIRNRKAEVGNFMPRRATRWPVELTEAEHRALTAVEHYVLDGYDRASATRDNATGFVMTVFQRLMASSISALRTSLAGRRDRLAGRAASAAPTSLADALEDDAPAADLVAVPTAGPDELAELDSLIALLSEVPADSKADGLVDNLATLFEEEPEERVLLFTEFRETQNYLAKRLKDRGWAVHLFHGQMSPEEKDASVDRFRNEAGPAIMISTESGGEGRNFQFCHIVVNYDLPWNPMRVEQRIGRVDRIGQDRVVQIFNMWVKGTIEERILDVLERRINVFVDTVGALDPILGDTERDLRRILRRSREERDRALAAFGEGLQERVEAARRAEHQLRDFIMDTKSFSRAIAEEIAGRPSPVTPDDQEAFMRSLLGDVRTHVDSTGDGEYVITFNEPFLSDFPEHIKEGRKRRIVFRADRRPDSEHVEYLAFGHPVVDSLLDRTSADSYPGSASALHFPWEALPAPQQGWWFNYVITVPSVQVRQEFVPIFVTADGRIDELLGRQLLEAARRFPRSTFPEAIPLEELEAAALSAERHAADILSKLEERIGAEAESQLGREKGRLRAYFDYRQRAACDRIDATRATLERLQGSEDHETRRIIPVWRTNLERDERILEELDAERDRRFAELERRARPRGDYQLICVARVELAPSETEPEQSPAPVGHTTGEPSGGG